MPQKEKELFVFNHGAVEIKISKEDDLFTADFSVKKSVCVSSATLAETVRELHAKISLAESDFFESLREAGSFLSERLNTINEEDEEDAK